MENGKSTLESLLAYTRQLVRAGKVMLSLQRGDFEWKMENLLSKVFWPIHDNLCVPVKSCCPCRGETLNGKWKIYSRKSFGLYKTCNANSACNVKYTQQLEYKYKGQITMMHVFYFFFEKIMHVLLREPNKLNLMSNLFFQRVLTQLWRSLLLIVLYHQTKTPIDFLCRRGLNLRSFIQPSETIPVKLTGTHNLMSNLKFTCH